MSRIRVSPRARLESPSRLEGEERCAHAGWGLTGEESAQRLAKEGPPFVAVTSPVRGLDGSLGCVTFDDLLRRIASQCEAVGIQLVVHECGDSRHRRLSDVGVAAAKSILALSSGRAE